MCVYIHFRPLPPPHTAIHDHVVLCAFRAYQQEVRRKVNSNSFVYLQVRLLKDILEAWKKEVEKKPSDLTLDEAYETLKVKKDPSG